VHSASYHHHHHHHHHHQRILSSGIQHHAVEQKLTSVLEEHIASIFRDEE
jgi:hypothetical protein